MNRIVLTIIVFAFSCTGFSQNNQVWTGFFSYNSIKDITQSGTSVIAASENAYFKRNITTNEVATTTTVEGLSGQTITQIYHSPTHNKTIIGHVDGLMVVVNELDGAMLNVVDIVNKVAVPSNKKRINHFTEFNGKLYISTDYGISVFDLQTSEFGDTYFIGPNGANIEIFQTTIFNNTIYTVANGYGLLSASVTNPNLIDFNQWTMVAGGSWKGVEAITNGVALIDSGTGLYNLVGNSPVYVTGFSQIPLDFRFVESKLLVTTQNFVYVLNGQLANLFTVNNTADPFVSFTSATTKDNKLYIGTKEKGVITTTQTNTTVFENITPNGPFRNMIFGVDAYPTGFWTVYGDYNAGYNPYSLDLLPVSKFNENGVWEEFPYAGLLGAKSIARSIVNPNNDKEVFFSSYYSGLLKFVDNVPTTIYNASNSSLQSIPGEVPDDVRVNGTGFDRNGNLWMTNSLVSRNLHVLKTDGSSVGYSLSCVLSPGAASLGRLAVDKNNTKWICTNFFGLIGFNESLGNKCISINEGADEGNLPVRDVRAVAVDNRNRLWIGTTKGLRVLSSVDSFLSESELETNPIIILEDGLAQELLYQQFITDIVIDGANNKWIGTAGSGVFFISQDGQKTFNIFTKENSPLPSNMINDIDINEVTGEVFIATEAGMVSYKGNATSGAGDLKNVVVFPNPVRPNFTGEVSITGLMDKCNVKITDISGNLVYEAIAQGGTVLWNTKAFDKYRVSSGVYIVHISSDDGIEVESKKIMIVR
jgi:hypothetical protein